MIQHVLSQAVDQSGCRHVFKILGSWIEINSVEFHLKCFELFPKVLGLGRLGRRSKTVQVQDLFHFSLHLDSSLSVTPCGKMGAPPRPARPANGRPRPAQRVSRNRAWGIQVLKCAYAPPPEMRTETRFFRKTKDLVSLSDLGGRPVRPPLFSQPSPGYSSLGLNIKKIAFMMIPATAPVAMAGQPKGKIPFRSGIGRNPPG